MPSGDEPPSSPPDASTSLEDALAYYKTQYEQLESELADFQASSRELEAELEKDIEASEKRERQLKEKADNLSYEVEEWKTKHKQAKGEANTVQNTLQKEITTLRDTNRTLQLRLRDIEVANDDFERQARHTTSSLEDVESKYNVAIERSVMLEEEIKVGEQEREALRIEAQRLRDELSDLKIESEIVRNKLSNLEQSSDRRSRKPTPLGPVVTVPQSPRSERSPDTAASSPTFATPPAKSASSGASDAPTPPSPPISDSSTKAPKPFLTPSLPKTRLSTTTDANTTPRPSHFSSRAARHSRGPSIPLSAHNGRSTPSVSYRRSIARPSELPPGLPQSGSLYQIRGLIGKMQKLEERVQSARSRLPAPVDTPPRASPRTGSALGHHGGASHLPSNVTVRSNRKRTGGSNISGASSLRDGESGTPSAIPRNTRLSFGQPPPTPTRLETSRPGSRASISSRNSINPHQHATMTSHSRPSSRQSTSRTPFGGAGSFAPNASTDVVRPKSSLSNYGGHARGQSMSVAEETESPKFSTPTPRRLTFGKSEGGSALPMSSATKKRMSNGAGLTVRRISSAAGLGKEEGDMGPPERRKGLQKTKLSGVGETY